MQVFITKRENVRCEMHTARNEQTHSINESWTLFGSLKRYLAHLNMSGEVVLSECHSICCSYMPSHANKLYKHDEAQ